MFSFTDLIKEKDRPLVMGILNITPDSFSDGGEAFNTKDILHKLNLLQEQGADIIDVGACSTAPMNELVSEKDEINRLKLFLKTVVSNSKVPVSIDTFRPSAAEYALTCGVKIINDESGCFKSKMAELVKKYGCGWIFMHTGESDSKNFVKYENSVTESVKEFFQDMQNNAIYNGIDKNQLCYDPGIGFGKTRQNDLELLRDTDVLSEKYSPILIGASRKRIIGEITGEPIAKNRAVGSAAAASLCAYKGASILRVHDVKETVDAIKIAYTIKRGVL